MFGACLVWVEAAVSVLVLQLLVQAVQPVEPVARGIAIGPVPAGLLLSATGSVAIALAVAGLPLLPLLLLAAGGRRQEYLVVVVVSVVVPLVPRVGSLGPEGATHELGAPLSVEDFQLLETLLLLSWV